MRNNSEPLTEPWLVHFHINNYVRPTDFRLYNRPNRAAVENAGFRRLIEKERRRVFKDEIRLDISRNISKEDI